MSIVSQKQSPSLRDIGLYSSRNTSKGALLEETARIIAALSSALSLVQVREQALDGRLLHQRARDTRKRIWRLVHYRLLAHKIEWIISDIKKAREAGHQSPEFVTLVYLHYALRDHLTFDFITQLIWNRRQSNQLAISREDLISFLDNADEDLLRTQRWTESTRNRLAASILTALRDFGLLKGTQKKKIVHPLLPLSTAEHLLRILTGEGLRGSQVLSDSTWRLFLLSSDDVAHVLSQLAQARRIHFERAGSTVMIETPAEWACLHESEHGSQGATI